MVTCERERESEEKKGDVGPSTLFPSVENYCTVFSIIVIKALKNTDDALESLIHIFCTISF